jgi:hypothetical protein
MNRMICRLNRVVLATALLLILPLLAMQVTGEVAWSPADFVVAGTLLAGTGFMYVLSASNACTPIYRAAVGMALAAALLLVWMNLAVGVIGTERNRANLIYVGVLAVGFVGALIARLRPLGMARALFATALAAAVVAAIALSLGLGSPESEPLEVLVLKGLFVALFTGSAVLFRKAARD